MNEMKHRRLQELDRSDFEIVDGEPDIRGWDVKNSAGLKIGEVEELIVDARQKKVRYMVVDLDNKDLKLPGRKVLIPIGLAELHEKDDDVILSTITVDQLGALPAYDKDNLNDDVEQKICTALGRAAEQINTLLQTGDTAEQTTGINASEESYRAKTEQPLTQPASQPAQGSASTTPSQAGQPPLGTAEYYGNFYQHAFFNDDNLYRNRQPQTEASNTNSDSDYERGLRLWEMRYEGAEESSDSAPQKHRERELSDEARMEMVRNRRKTYEERKGSFNENRQGDGGHHRRDNTIIGRIRDEGLQDA